MFLSLAASWLFLFFPSSAGWSSTGSRCSRASGAPGAVLVVAEAIYTVTDPPLKLLRRLIPPLRSARSSLDLAFWSSSSGVDPADVL